MPLTNVNCVYNSGVAILNAQPNQRVIRSFIRRAGRITAAQQRNLDILWNKYGLEITTEILALDNIFERQAPLWLEIGFGNGEFLANIAINHPEINFLGIEVHPPGIGHLLGRLHNNNLNNVRIFNQDAVEVLRYNIQDNSLQRIFIFFPDPWPKQKHRKRRLIQTPFINLLEKKCAQGSLLNLATDCEDYALQMMDVLSHAANWNNPNGTGIFSEHSAERILTKFEKRGLSLGYKVWDLTFKKIAND